MSFKEVLQRCKLTKYLAGKFIWSALTWLSFTLKYWYLFLQHSAKPSWCHTGPKWKRSDRFYRMDGAKPANYGRPGYLSFGEQSSGCAQGKGHPGNLYVRDEFRVCNIWWWRGYLLGSYKSTRKIELCAAIVQLICLPCFILLLV